MQRGDQRIVDLQHWLAAGQHDEAVVAPRPPKPRQQRRQFLGVGEFPAVLAVHADKVGVAKTADRRARSSSRPLQRLQPEKRQNTAARPA